RGVESAHEARQRDPRRQRRRPGDPRGLPARRRPARARQPHHLPVLDRQGARHVAFRVRTRPVRPGRRSRAPGTAGTRVLRRAPGDPFHQHLRRRGLRHGQRPRLLPQQPLGEQRRPDDADVRPRTGRARAGAGRGRRPLAFFRRLHRPPARRAGQGDPGVRRTFAALTAWRDLHASSRRRGTDRPPAGHTAPQPARHGGVMTRPFILLTVAWSPLAAAAGITFSTPETVIHGPPSAIRLAISPDGAHQLWGEPRAPEDGGLDIRERRRLADGWSEPEDVAFNSPWNDFDPAFAADGSGVYFFSDRPGGLGGDDIWFVPLEGGAWGEPVNLGAPVNTPTDE